MSSSKFIKPLFKGIYVLIISKKLFEWKLDVREHRYLNRLGQKLTF